MSIYVDARKRLPTKYGSYFIKINGRHDVMNYHEFTRMIDRLHPDDTFVWVDESEIKKDVIIEQPKKEFSFRSDENPNVSDDLVDRLRVDAPLKANNIAHLENLFGVKRAAIISKKLSKIKKIKKS